MYRTTEPPSFYIRPVFVPHFISIISEACSWASSYFLDMRLRTAFFGPLLATATLAQNGTKSTKYAVQTPPLTTNWTYTVGTNPWPEYPRPQLARSDWQSLNGIWTYQNTTSLNGTPPFGQVLPNEVLIPSCLESGLSGTYSSRMKFDLTYADEIYRNSRRIHDLFLVQKFLHCSIILGWKTSIAQLWSCGL